MIQIRNLTGLSDAKLYEGFSRAFAEYPVQMNEEQFFMMIRRRGYDPALSFGAFEDEKLVSFTLNGIGNFNGLPTAYDTGTGTMKEYRGRGLASGIFQHSLPFLKEKGIRQYLLEVLQENDTAVSVYRKQGFRVSREFTYSVEEISKLNFQKNTGGLYTFREAGLDQVRSLEDSFAFEPSWQNSFESIERRLMEFRIIAAFRENELAGFVITEYKSGDLTLLAVNQSHRRKGLGTELVKQAAAHSKSGVLKFINSDASCALMHAFLASIGVETNGKQFEMILELS